jgi:hypothetical protein
MKTLKQYFLENSKNGVIEHTVRSSVDSEGNVTFYIHPASVGGDTLDFLVCTNTLIPMQQDYSDGTKHIKTIKDTIDDYHYSPKSCSICNEN